MMTSNDDLESRQNCAMLKSARTVETSTWWIFVAENGGGGCAGRRLPDNCVRPRCREASRKQTTGG